MGITEIVICRACKGTGEVESDALNHRDSSKEPCWHCKGHGRVLKYVVEMQFSLEERNKIPEVSKIISQWTYRS